MKLALIFFSVLTSLSMWFAAQETPPVICRGKPLSITLLPDPKMSGPTLPLRFGGTRQLPRPPVNSVPSDNAFRLVIKNRDEFSNFWKRLTARVPPGQWVPPLPEIDFSKEMVVVAAMGRRPSPGYWTITDGACEVDGHRNGMRSVMIEYPRRGWKESGNMQFFPKSALYGRAAELVDGKAAPGVS